MISVKVDEGAVTMEGRDVVDMGSATSGKEDDEKVTVGMNDGSLPIGLGSRQCCGHRLGC